MLKFLGSFVFVSLIVLDSVTAAEWQTPAQAMQLVAAPVASPTVITAPAPDYFAITSSDVTQEVERQLMSQGMANVSAVLTPNSGTLYSANHPLTLAIQGLQIDQQAGLWQGQAYILGNGKTESVKPVSGRYDLTQSVPVLTRQLRTGDIIEASDLTSKTIAARQLRKDTITETRFLIGQSPVRAISPGRPMRSGEVTQPTVVKKGDLVQMNYTTPYMSIRTTGEALENGANGALIRVKNSKTEKAISARVVSAGTVEVNNTL